MPKHEDAHAPLTCDCGACEFDFAQNAWMWSGIQLTCDCGGVCGAGRAAHCPIGSCGDFLSYDESGYPVAIKVDGQENLVRIVDLQMHARENEPFEVRAEFGGRMVLLMANCMADWFRQQGGANFMSMEVKGSDPDDRYSLILQKAEGKTPREVISELRAEVDRLARALDLATETVNTTAANVEKAMANAADAARKEAGQDAELGRLLRKASESRRFTFSVSEGASSFDVGGDIDRVACYVRERMGRDAEA